MELEGSAEISRLALEVNQLKSESDRLSLELTKEKQEKKAAAEKPSISNTQDIIAQLNKEKEELAKRLKEETDQRAKEKQAAATLEDELDDLKDERNELKEQLQEVLVLESVYATHTCAFRIRDMRLVRFVYMWGCIDFIY